MTTAVLVFILTACGGGNALDPEADDPNLSDDEWAREVWKLQLQRPFLRSQSSLQSFR